LTTPRFFLSTTDLARNRVTLSGECHHHLSRVLRARPGDEVWLLDGRGGVARASVERMERDATVLVVEERERVPEERPRMHLYQALLKGVKMDQVIQAAVELGASSIVPYICRRSLPPRGDVERRVERWRSIALQASRVAGRAYLPRVGAPLSWEEMVEALAGADLSLFADERGGERVASALRNRRAGDVVLVVGPEGGFDDAERDEMRSRGARPVTLGPNILRAESAGAVFLAAARCGCDLL